LQKLTTHHNILVPNQHIRYFLHVKSHDTQATTTLKNGYPYHHQKAMKSTIFYDTLLQRRATISRASDATGGTYSSVSSCSHLST
jgi:hypothetical protein